MREVNFALRTRVPTELATLWERGVFKDIGYKKCENALRTARLAIKAQTEKLVLITLGNKKIKLYTPTLALSTLINNLLLKINAVFFDRWLQCSRWLMTKKCHSTCWLSSETVVFLQRTSQPRWSLSSATCATLRNQHCICSEHFFLWFLFRDMKDSQKRQVALVTGVTGQVSLQQRVGKSFVDYVQVRASGQRSTQVDLCQLGFPV